MNNQMNSVRKLTKKQLQYPTLLIAATLELSQRTAKLMHFCQRYEKLMHFVIQTLG